MATNENVFVAMSGGVDSTVAAVLLQSQGYRVTGIFMKTWQDPKWLQKVEHDPSPEEEAQSAADRVGIPLVVVDVRDPFYTQVVQVFIRQYLAGQTPNPCLFCNPQVKWGILQKVALERGADYFATGHYARIKQDGHGKVQLLRGVDPRKDQSYVLSMLTQEQLFRSRLPLGEMTKDEVREFAHSLGVDVTEKQESQDLCFLGDIDYRDFLQRYAPEASSPGEIVNQKGNVVGEHEGLAFYTIGQRKGIRVSASEPFYVVGKDLAHNRLIIGYADQAGKNCLVADGANWISGDPPKGGAVYEAMVRYRAKPIPAIFSSVTPNQFRLEFKEDLRGITPGQVAVLYRGEACLGGGTIRSSGCEQTH